MVTSYLLMVTSYLLLIIPIMFPSNVLKAATGADCAESEWHAAKIK